MDAQVLTGKILTGCHLTGFLVGSILEDLRCLIKSGIPQNATFERTGDILRDGVTFAADAPVVQNGRYHHNGLRTNRILHNSDLTQASWTKRGTASVDPDGKTITVNTGQNDVFQIASGYGNDKAVDLGFYFNRLSETFGVVSVVSPLGAAFGNWQLNISLVDDGDVFITKEHPAITEVDDYMSNSSGQSGVLFRSLTAELTFKVWDIVIIESEYSIYPITIPTTGSPASIDTSASQPNPDKHGLNWEFSDPKNGWAWDLLDGLADGIERWQGGFSLSPNTTENNGVFGASVSGSGNDNRIFFAIDPPLPDSRFEIRGKCLVSGVFAVFDGVGYTTSNATPGPITRRGVAATPTSAATKFQTAGMEITDISIRSVNEATGTLNLKGLSVVPAVTEWQTTGDFNILSGATGNQILYIESGTGLICATDGTNTTKSVQPYVAGQDHTVSLAFGDSKMQIYVDGVNGTQVPFVGTFTPGETLKWGLNNEDIFSIGNVCGQTTSSFSESVHLAEELAYDL